MSGAAVRRTSRAACDKAAGRQRVSDTPHRRGHGLNFIRSLKRKSLMREYSPSRDKFNLIYWRLRSGSVERLEVGTVRSRRHGCRHSQAPGLDWFPARRTPWQPLGLVRSPRLMDELLNFAGQRTRTRDNLGKLLKLPVAEVNQRIANTRNARHSRLSAVLNEDQLDLDKVTASSKSR